MVQPPTNSERLYAINTELSTVIETVKTHQLRAMLDLELMKPTTMMYKNASIRFSIASYMLPILIRIKTTAETGDMKKTENVIRFHAYQIGAYGTPTEMDEISKAQKNVKDILDYIIKEHIEK